MMGKSVLAGHMVRAMDHVVVAIPGEFKQAVQAELGRAQTWPTCARNSTT